jgi:hypothetical protein
VKLAELTPRASGVSLRSVIAPFVPRRIAGRRRLGRVASDGGAMVVGRVGGHRDSIGREFGDGENDGDSDPGPDRSVGSGWARLREGTETDWVRDRPRL